MLIRLVTNSVRFATRHAWGVILTTLLLTLASGIYAARHFAINTDIGRLLDKNESWAQHDAAISAAFPQRDQLIIAVVQAPASELAAAAADALAEALRRQPARFRTVSQPGGGDFFVHNGLLFLSRDKLSDMTGRLVQAHPLLNALAHDPSLRGLADTLSTTLALPLQIGQVKLGDMARLLGSSAVTLEQVLAGKPAALSWAALGGMPGPEGQASSFVSVSPILDFSDLEAGAKASDAIRAAAAQLRLQERYSATVRLTGPQPLADDEFSSIKDGALVNGVFTVLVVILILWLALRSPRLILAVLVNVFAGLTLTAAFGLFLVGALNMISIAFAVLFIGLGVDFGIQFGVRYRARRYRYSNLALALSRAAQSVGMPLALAAAATAAAFFSFVPTSYRGLAELGKIAGSGMIIAFATTATAGTDQRVTPPRRDQHPRLCMVGARRQILRTSAQASAADYMRGNPDWNPAAAAPALRLQSVAPERPALGVNVDPAVA